MEQKFDKNSIKKVSIDLIHPNSYNPKDKNTKEYKKVVESIKKNGLMKYINVRREAGTDGYIIVDGEQRYTAAKELGYREMYIYDLGEISEEEAISLTIWMETQVPFDEIMLAPIVVDLADKGIDIGLSESAISDFRDLISFDLDNAFEDKEPVAEEGDKFKAIKIKMEKDKLDFVRSRIKEVVLEENVSEGRALEILVCNL